MNENKSPGQPIGAPRKRFFGIILIAFAIWLAITWLLWLGVKNAPIKHSDPDEKPFQIIPLSED